MFSTWSSLRHLTVLLLAVAVLLAAALHDIVARTATELDGRDAGTFGLVSGLHGPHGRPLTGWAWFGRIHGRGILLAPRLDGWWRRETARAAAIVVPPVMLSSSSLQSLLAGAALALIYLVAQPHRTRPRSAASDASACLAHLASSAGGSRRGGPLPYAWRSLPASCSSLFRRSIRWSCASCSSP